MIPNWHIRKMGPKTFGGTRDPRPENHLLAGTPDPTPGTHLSSETRDPKVGIRDLSHGWKPRPQIIKVGLNTQYMGLGTQEPEP